MVIYLILAGVNFYVAYKIDKKGGDKTLPMVVGSVCLGLGLGLLFIK
jgi:uncharacterized protein (DUF2062 family)